MSGLAILLAILYVGLNAAEQGTQELVGLKEARQALFFTTGENGLNITFAGREYALPWKLIWERLLRYYF